MRCLYYVAVCCAVLNFGLAADQYRGSDDDRRRDGSQPGYPSRDGYPERDRYEAGREGRGRADGQPPYARNQDRYRQSYDRDVLGQQTLSVTAIQAAPFTSAVRDQQIYEGMAVDILKEMCRRVGCWYDIHMVRDGKYGNLYSGSWDGMIGEVFSGAADLALGPLTITSQRRQAVDFTRQWLDSPLAVLVRRKTGMVTIGQLANQTHVRYGALRDGLTMRLMSGSSSGMLRRMSSTMQSNPQWLVRSEQEGLRRVRNENYALIMERPRALYLAARDCRLRAFGRFLDNGQGYGFALRKGDPRLASMNVALNEMRRDGTLDETRRRWLRNDCPYDRELARAESAAPAAVTLTGACLVAGLLATLAFRL